MANKKSPQRKPIVGIATSKGRDQRGERSRANMVGKAKDAHNRRRRRIGGQ